MFARIEITPQRNAREKDEAREQLALDSIIGFVYTGSSPKSIISGRIPARDTTMPVLPRYPDLSPVNHGNISQRRFFTSLRLRIRPA